jgi:hypothetical protein
MGEKRNRWLESLKKRDPFGGHRCGWKDDTEENVTEGV